MAGGTSAKETRPPTYSEVVFPVDPQMAGNLLVWRMSSIVGLGAVTVNANEGELNVEVSPHGFLAVWDTGAPRTIVAPSVAEQVGLQPHGIVPISGVTGERRSWKVARLTVAMQAWTRNRTRPHNHFHIVEEAAIAERDSDLGFQVLLGMDVIMRGDLELATDRAGRRVVIWKHPTKRRAIRYPPPPPVPQVG